MQISIKTAHIPSLLGSGGLQLGRLSFTAGRLQMANDTEVSQVVAWRTVMKSLSPESRKTAQMWLWYTLFYWLMPTLIVLLGRLIARQALNPVELVRHGELLIYAITLTAGSTRLIAKDATKLGPFVNRQGFNFWAQVILFPAIFTYGLLRYLGSSPSQNGINLPLVVSYSIIILIAAFYFSYVVFRVDVQRTAQFQNDIQKRTTNAIAHSPDELNQAFDRIQANEAVIEKAEEQEETEGTQEADTKRADRIVDALPTSQNDLETGFDRLEGDK